MHVTFFNKVGSNITMATCIRFIDYSPINIIITNSVIKFVNPLAPIVATIAAASNNAIPTRVR